MRNKNRAVDGYLATPGTDVPPARRPDVVAPAVDRLVDALELERDRADRWRAIAVNLYAPHTCNPQGTIYSPLEQCRRCTGEGAFMFELNYRPRARS